MKEIRANSSFKLGNGNQILRFLGLCIFRAVL